MKTTAANPRLLCRVVRLRHALAATPGDTGHAARCPDCQAYYRATAALEHALRREAAHAPRDVPAALAARIARSVRAAADETERVRPSRPSRPSRRARRPATPNFNLGWTLAGAAAGIALALLIVNRPAPDPTGAPPQTAAAEITPGDVAVIVADVNALGIRLLGTVEPAAERLAGNNPLAAELDAIKADARNALGYLALNFLPTAPEPDPASS